MTDTHRDGPGRLAPIVKGLALGSALVATTLLLGGSMDARADDDDHEFDDDDNGAFCSRTSHLALRACRNELRDDFFTAKANCVNVSDDEERATCFAEARDARAEGKSLCREQLEARQEVCGAIGEARYDPDFDPGNFVHANNLSGNTYFPLNVGNRWVFEGGDETITVEVLAKTKDIEGVTCRVVSDVVKADGELIEDTNDWYAEATNGDVHYCGEIAKDFETFEGDDPEEPELVEIEGSWKAGRDGDKSGIIMFASPPEGVTYREEFSLGNAEDMSEVLSNTYSYGVDHDLDQFVPQALAKALCDGDCVVTRDFTPIEPGVEERKYYAPGVGVFLEVNVDTGDTVELVDCNLAPCSALPTP